MNFGGNIKENRHFHGFNYYREAEEQFIKVIEENREYFKAEEAVDLGAGGGTFSKLLSKYVRKLYSLDVSEDAIEAMKKNLAVSDRIIAAGFMSTPMQSSDRLAASNNTVPLPTKGSNIMSPFLEYLSRNIPASPLGNCPSTLLV